MTDAPVARWALLLEYDGAGFAGWQRQEGFTTVQRVLEEAASRLDGAPVAAVAAGRTDAGVHAEGQVAHIALRRSMTAGSLAAALNYHMKPHRVSVLRAAIVDPTWSARFSAIGRRYRYAILCRAARPALEAGRVWHVRQTLDVEAMRRGAALLLGHHDFTSFRASSCQAKSPLRTLDRLDVQASAERIVMTVEARSFLHHQVRNMVGSLALVGSLRWAPARIEEALEARNRAAAGPTAPAAGLTLQSVRYDNDVFPGTLAE